MVHDSDGFNRWEAGQTFALRSINRVIDGAAVEESLLKALENLLDQALQEKGDKALLARALTLPDIQIIAQTRDIVDPDAIYKAREAVRVAFAERNREKILAVYNANSESGAYSVSPDAMAKRSLKNTMLGYLDDASLAKSQYETATNMTDRVAAMAVLKDHEGAEKDAVFTDFHERFKAYPLVIDKWFSLQATAVNDNIIANVKRLSSHADFTLLNPNRARSLYGAFAMNNPVGFHRADGSGYVLLKEAVTQLNSKNPQIAARLLTPLREWKRYTPDRQEKMKSVLEDISKIEKISPDVFEIVSKSLQA
jgi:aminopeptidase N